MEQQEKFNLDSRDISQLDMHDKKIQMEMSSMHHSEWWLYVMILLI